MYIFVGCKKELIFHPIKIREQDPLKQGLKPLYFSYVCPACFYS